MGDVVRDEPEEAVEAYVRQETGEDLEGVGAHRRDQERLDRRGQRPPEHERPGRVVAAAQPRAPLVVPRDALRYRSRSGRDASKISRRRESTSTRSSTFRRSIARTAVSIIASTRCSTSPPGSPQTKDGA